MNKFLSIITAVTLLLALASSGEAWQVDVKNSCDKDVHIVAYGHHLIWTQIDCWMKVEPGKTGTCILPWGIGLYSVKGDTMYLSPITKERVISHLNEANCFSGLPCVWNVKYEVVKSGDSCFIELR